MQYKFIVSGLALISIIICGSSTIIKDNSKEHYKNYCASCHGSNLEGFVNRKWKYGVSDAEVYKSIKVGIENAGMPAYEKTFSDAEIKSLVSYIKNAHNNKEISKADSKKSGVYQSEEFKIKVDTITDVVDVPWGIEFLPDNSMLITDRDGDFYHRHLNGKMVKITATPQVYSRGQGGLLDVLLHPDCEKNNFIYLSYSKSVFEDTREKSTTAMCRAELRNDTLFNVKEIFIAKPYFETQHHYGSRMVFDENGYLFISVGERGKENINPQDLSSDCGKVHRLKDDGSIPEDNPFVKVNSASASVYTYGHRNPQGMAINPETKTIWVNEHGPKGGDEINLLRQGANFGWPITTFGINYNGTTITDKTSSPGVSDPLLYWIPSIAPCGAIFVEGDKYGNWKGDYMVPSLSFNYLNRCKVNGDKVSGQEKLIQDIGRMRCIKQSKDGYIYIGVEQPGLVLRLMPIW